MARPDSRRRRALLALLLLLLFLGGVGVARNAFLQARGEAPEVPAPEVAVQEAAPVPTDTVVQEGPAETPSPRAPTGSAPVVAPSPPVTSALEIPAPAPREVVLTTASLTGSEPPRLPVLTAAVDGGSPVTEPAIPASEAPQQILLDLRFGRMTTTTVEAYSDGARALLPAFAFLELAEVEVRRDSLGAVEAVLHPQGRRVRISADSLVAWLDHTPLPLDPGDVVAGEDEIYLSTPVLEALLGVVIRTNWVTLTTTVMNPEALPLGQRLIREARWARIRAETVGKAPAPVLELESSAVGGAVADWSVSSNAREPGESLAYAVGVAARVLGGSAQVSARSLGPVATSGDRVDASWETVLDGVDWLSQIRLGDGFTTGPRFRDIRGFSLTNAPYLRSSEFGSDIFAGRVGPGWEVELRQSGQTLDLTRADEQGAFALDIPLRYGENAIQVLAFGPHGEVITADRLMLLGMDRLPGGDFEWGLSGGRCRTTRCAETGNLDLRYGLTDRWTVQGGAELFTRDATATLFQPYLKLNGMLLQSLEVSVEGVHDGFLRGGATFAPSPWVRMRGAHTAFSTALADPVLHDARRRSTTEADVFFRPDPENPRLFLRGSLIRQELTTGTLDRIQASATVPLGSVAVEAGVRREVDDPAGSALLTRDYQFAAVNGNVRVAGRHRFWVRGEVEVREAELMNRLRARLAYQLNQGTRFEVSAGWQKNFGANLTFTVSALLSEFRSVVQLNAAEGAPAQLTQVSQGTLHWNDATGGVSLASGPGLQRGGISGYVFLDGNGNGVRDAGEEGLEGVRLVVGGRPVVTDADGRHTSWDLIPYQSVEIWTDSASIQDPTLVPTRNQVRVEVPPSSFGRVDVPVTPSREVVGRVVRVDGEVALPIPYAELEMVHRETGEVRSLRAFSDGEFYEAGIRPGSYELRLAPDYARRAGLVPEGEWARVEVVTDGSLAPVGPVVLRVVSGGGEEDDDGWVEATPGNGGPRGGAR